MVVQLDEEPPVERLIEDRAHECEHCGNVYITLRGLATHEQRCDEAEERIRANGKETDYDVGIVDAEHYYAVGSAATAYHIDEECPVALQMVNAGDKESSGHSSEPIRERSRRYVEWHDMKPCYHCVTGDDSCANM